MTNDKLENTHQGSIWKYIQRGNSQITVRDNRSTLFGLLLNFYYYEKLQLNLLKEVSEKLLSKYSIPSIGAFLKIWAGT